MSAADASLLSTEQASIALSARLEVTTLMDTSNFAWKSSLVINFLMIIKFFLFVITIFFFIFFYFMPLALVLLLVQAPSKGLLFWALASPPALALV
jgi:hypothetical protein